MRTIAVAAILFCVAGCAPRQNGVRDESGCVKRQEQIDNGALEAQDKAQQLKQLKKDDSDSAALDGF